MKAGEEERTRERGKGEDVEADEVYAEEAERMEAA